MKQDSKGRDESKDDTRRNRVAVVNHIFTNRVRFSVSDLPDNDVERVLIGENGSDSPIGACYIESILKVHVFVYAWPYRRTPFLGRNTLEDKSRLPPGRQRCHEVLKSFASSTSPLLNIVPRVDWLNDGVENFRRHHVHVQENAPVEEIREVLGF